MSDVRDKYVRRVDNEFRYVSVIIFLYKKKKQTTEFKRVGLFCTIRNEIVIVNCETTDRVDRKLLSEHEKKNRLWRCTRFPTGVTLRATSVTLAGSWRRRRRLVVKRLKSEEKKNKIKVK